VDVQSEQFRVGITHSVVSPVALLIILLAGVAICVSGRRIAAGAFLASSILIPMDQILVLGPLHFPMLRVLVLFGFARIVREKLSFRNKVFSGGINGIDKAMIGLTLFTALNGIVLWRDSASIIFQLGNMYAGLGVYCLLRFLIRSREDVTHVLRVLACVAVGVAAIMICEQATGQNPVHLLLGGARFSSGSVLERDGHLRARGSFSHPILAGTFGGIVLPLFVGLWTSKEKRDRKYASVGAVSAIVIPLAANSSTALFGLLGGIVGLCLWPLRQRMRILRWSIVVLLVSLHLVMKAPVWHLISRVDLTGGSSSYHRYQLINQCILHFWEWALLGTKGYGFWGWDMWDLSNQYVAIADTSGLIPLACFVAMIAIGFRYVGKARRASAGGIGHRFLLWAIGASLFANVVAFVGVCYFDQTVVIWYAVLAMIGASWTSVRRDGRKAALASSHDTASVVGVDVPRRSNHLPSMVPRS
jgi:hypothetical protein